MATNIATLSVALVAKSEAFVRGMNKATRPVESFTRKIAGLGKSLVKFGAATALAGGTAAVGLGAVMGKLGSDATESESLFKTVFGNIADVVHGWSEKVGHDLRINSFRLRESSALLFTMFESMGLSRRYALDMAKSITILAKDIESFYNLASGEGLEKLRAGLTGEAEPLKRLGILVSETAVKQFLLENRFKGNIAALTESQKVYARYLKIVDSTRVASGDLARTMLSTSNLFKSIKANMLEILAIGGLKLIVPGTEVVLKDVSDFVQRVEDFVKGPDFDEWAEKVREWGREFYKTFQNIVGGISLSFKHAIENMDNIKDSVSGMSGSLSDVAGSVSSVNDSLGSAEAVFDSILQVSNDIANAWSNVVESISRVQELYFRGGQYSFAVLSAVATAPVKGFAKLMGDQDLVDSIDNWRSQGIAGQRDRADFSRDRKLAAQASQTNRAAGISDSERDSLIRRAGALGGRHGRAQGRIASLEVPARGTGAESHYVASFKRQAAMTAGIAPRQTETRIGFVESQIASLRTRGREWDSPQIQKLIQVLNDLNATLQAQGPNARELGQEL